MTYVPESEETRGLSRYVSRSVGGAAEAVVAARGDARRMKMVFERSLVPIVILDSRRRYVDVNRPAQLWFRRSIEDMRGHAIEDFAPPDQRPFIDAGWKRLMETGCVSRSYRAAKPDGTRVETVYFALADALPALHIIVFAPADWPEEELPGIAQDDSDADGTLTPREVEVLGLTADGLTGPELAHELVLSPATVSTHFQNIYAKLRVRSRTGAVAKAMRLGLID